MNTLLIVFGKEIREHARDRRTLLTSLLLGPVLGPVFFAFAINLSIERSVGGGARVLKLPVIGAEHAPNVMRFLHSRRIQPIDGPPNLAAAKRAVTNGRLDVVLRIPPEFGAQLLAGVSARIELVSDFANSAAQRDTRRVREALRDYSRELASVRLSARGLSPMLMRPINVDAVDVSTPSGRSALLLGVLGYFCVLSLLAGGMNLAIDSTAGERERGSLEPLLALPLSRTALMLGKIAATCLFMMLALALNLATFAIALPFVPLAKFGMTPNFGVGTLGFALLLFLPFSLLGAAMMTLLASFTKSFKEAQSWVSILLLAPTLPVLLVSILALRPRLEFMFIPSLSQHLLLIERIKGEPLEPVQLAISMLSTLLIGTALTALCARRYRQEKLLA